MVHAEGGVPTTTPTPTTLSGQDRHVDWLWPVQDAPMVQAADLANIQPVGFSVSRAQQGLSNVLPVPIPNSHEREACMRVGRWTWLYFQLVMISFASAWLGHGAQICGQTLLSVSARLFGDVLNYI